jgi:hypothetical protein
MSLDWYVFEESYLINIHYEINKCLLHLLIDAKKSIHHPEADKIKIYEDSFELIDITLKGIQYYRGICSLNISKDPNSDIGSIHQLSIGTSTPEDGILMEDYDNSLLKVSMESNNQIIGEIYSQSTNIKFLELVSEMTSFRAGFSEWAINRRE